MTQSLLATPVLMVILVVIVYIFRVPFLRLLGSSDILLPKALSTTGMWLAVPLAEGQGSC